MNLTKKLFVALLCSAIVVTPVFALNVNAATFAQVNQENVFVNQKTDYTCTLAANVMMIRRAAMMYGYSDWASITEDTCRPIMWSSGGMVFEYNYRVFSVENPVISQLQRQYGVTDRKELFIRVLKDHPEGVVIYDYDRPHAILLTDYTNGTFYCSDPWYEQPKARIPMSQSNVNIYNVESVWLVASPDLYLTSNSTATSVTSSSGVSNVNETWKVTDDAGLNLRSGAGTYNSIIGYVPQNAVVNVTKKTSNGGYTWGYVSYQSKNGWIALDYATKVSTNTAKTTASTETAKSDSTAVTESKLPESTHLVFENTSAISATEISLGDTLKLKGSASKGTAPYTYAYYSKKSASSSWGTVQDFSEKNTAELTPLSPGDYDVCIKVKDAKGNVEKKYMTFKVKNTLVNQSTLSASKAYVGDEVKITGKAKGGIGSYTYAYYQKRHESDSWVTIKDFSTDTTASITPMKDTAYDICIKVKDSAGNVEKVYKTLNVTKLVNHSTVSATSIKLGQNVTLKGSSSGGMGSCHYAYYYKRTDSNSWTTLQDFSRCLIANLKPTKTGTYDVCVKVKDANGKIAKKYFTVKVTK